MTMPNKRYPDYVADLAALPAAVREALPISIGPSGVVSYYGDAVWDFRSYIDTKNVPSSKKRIDFSALAFSDGSRLTDPRHATLLAGVKAYLYVRLSHKHPVSGKPLKHQTVCNVGRNLLRPLLYWMVGNGHWFFADLTPAACRAYVAASQQLVTDKGVRLKARSLQSRFAVLEDLHGFREHLVDTLPEHPWPGESAGSIAGLKRGGTHRAGTTERIPDRLARQLAQGALRYVESDYGERLLACRAAWSAREAFDEHLAELKLKDWAAVRKEIGRLYVACYVITDLFSGMRDSEMASLEIGCYGEHEGWDGAIYGWLKGTTYKTEPDPKPAEWMVPPVVAKAVALAEQVAAPIRAELEARIAGLEARLAAACYLDETVRAQDVETLHECRRHRRSLFLGKSLKDGSIATWNCSRTGMRLKAFAQHLGLRVEAADLAQVRAKDRIRVGETWPLAPHQFRKTFAVYVARNVLGDVRYLREHFKHWSLDMTLYYAVADLDYLDETLFEEVLSERDELQAIILEGWIETDKPLAGGGARKVKEWRERHGVRVAKNHRDLARKFAAGFFLRGTGHSWCTSEACKGMGLYNVLECKDCENRFIDETHLLVWRGIRAQQIELLQMDDLGDPMWQRAADHLRYAEKILRDLNDPVEPYPIPPKPSERRSVKA